MLNLNQQRIQHQELKTKIPFFTKEEEILIMQRLAFYGLKQSGSEYILYFMSEDLI